MLTIAAVLTLISFLFRSPSTKKWMRIIAGILALIDVIRFVRQLILNKAVGSVIPPSNNPVQSILTDSLQNITNNAVVAVLPQNISRPLSIIPNTTNSGSLTGYGTSSRNVNAGYNLANSSWRA